MAHALDVNNEPEEPIEDEDPAPEIISDIPLADMNDEPQEPIEDQDPVSVTGDGLVSRENVA